MFQCIEIPKHWRLSLFRCETFINFLWLLVFRHDRERHTQFLLCWLFLHRSSVNPNWTLDPESRSPLTDPTNARASRSPQTVPALPSFIYLKSLLLFKITKIPSPSLPGMTSFTPQSRFLSGVFIMTFVIAMSSAHERELYSMCAPAPALSRIVLSLTKPNDTI